MAISKSFYGYINNFYGHFPVRKLLVYQRVPQRAALHALPCPGESHHMDRLKFCNFKYDLTSRGLRRVFFFVRGNDLVPDIHAATKVLICLCIIYIILYYTILYYTILYYISYYIILYYIILYIILYYIWYIYIYNIMCIYIYIILHGVYIYNYIMVCYVYVLYIKCVCLFKSIYI